MKRVILAIVMLVIGVAAQAQENFKWDVIIDSLENDKSELYSKTKLFISETWKSAQDVIQNDDKEGGVVVVKAVNLQSLNFQMSDHTWTYEYTIKFYTRDNKCRIIIDNVHNTYVRHTTNLSWPLMPVADAYPQPKKVGGRLTYVKEEQYLLLMGTLKSELQGIANSYSEYLKKPSDSLDSDW